MMNFQTTPTVSSSSSFIVMFSKVSIPADVLIFFLVFFLSLDLGIDVKRGKNYIHFFSSSNLLGSFQLDGGHSKKRLWRNVLIHNRSLFLFLLFLLSFSFSLFLSFLLPPSSNSSHSVQVSTEISD